MKIFLSWSGERSRQAALALRSLLDGIFNPKEEAGRPLVWMSDKDIHSGERWPDVLAAGLDAKFAILCLTPECADKPWIFFEAGAIAKAIFGRSRVVPYLLFGLQLQDLPDPFRQFQANVADPKGTFGVDPVWWTPIL
jgi:hypothetical protein